MAIICRRFLISGRVQGVFYRQTTIEQARSLGLNGWARNLPDGRVEVLACGEERTLQKLEQWLWRGPRLAEVEAVQFESAVAEPDMHGFQIKY